MEVDGALVAAAEKRRQIRETGFWFVDIPRTSSSSLRAELGAKFGGAHGKVGEIAKGEAVFIHAHVSAARFRKWIGADVWDELHTVSMVRNPWSRALSLYTLRKKHWERRSDFDWTLENHLRGIADARAGRITNAIFDYKPAISTASEFVCDRNGTLIVDQILRFEDRREDLKRFGAQIGMPTLGGGERSNSTSPKGSYTEAFTPTARQLVAEIYKDDCERFGYAFGDP